MVFGVFRLRTRKDNERGNAVASTALLVFLMLMFAESSTGGGGKNGYPGGSFWSAAGGPSNFGLAIAVTAMAGLAVAATVVYSRRGKLKSPWSRRRRKQALCLKQWNSFFTADGRFDDGGVKFLKKVRSGGVDPSIRAEVWPFLLGVYELNSSKEERDSIREQKRKEYVNLRKQYCQIYRSTEKSSGSNERAGCGEIGDREEFSQVFDSRELKEVNSSRRSPFPDGQEFDQPTSDSQLDGDCNQSVITSEDASDEETESTVSRASEENEILPLLSAAEVDATNSDECGNDNPPPSSAKRKAKSHTDEDLATWQRIIRLDAVRANDEWVIYSPCQASVSEAKARQLATRVHLKDYEHLEPCRVFHAARLVAILEAYAVYDPEIGYCQGMSDLLSPIISVLEEDHLAFWCFVGFMRKARHNFRLDEVGIRRQLGMVSKIIKCKDIHLFRHLEKLQAEDCFFVYRMVVVLFRRELTFEQTLCLWEVMWADQAVIRAGIAKSTWGRIRLRTPPTEDLLLYAIAACVLQKRKMIIEKYSSMDEIMRECNSMAGHLDVWKLLDDAHDLVINLHDKV